MSSTITIIELVLFNLFTAGLAYVLATLWVKKKLKRLGPIIHKAQRLISDAKATRKFHSESDQQLDLFRARDEWDELDQALDLMKSDIQGRDAMIKKEREELSTLMESISEAILAIDADGKPLFFNTRVCELFGGTKPELKKLRLGEIIRNPEIQMLFLKAFQLGERASEQVHLRTALKGEAKEYSIAVSPLRTNAGDIYAVVGVFYDVTEIKRAEQIRIDFVANVSHELKTPMTAIKGFSDTLLKDYEDGRSENYGFYVDKIQKNLVRLMSLVEDLLNLSSLESGTDLMKTPISLPELTDRVMMQFHQKILEKRFQIIPQIDIKTLNADPKRVEQVVTNLLDNALKYNPAGAKIELIWRENPRAVEFQVRDNGPGIAREVQSRLFERFFRIDSGRARDQGGTGLGLAIVKHIMKRHGGTIRVESELGQGTTFICEFPKEQFA